MTDTLMPPAPAVEAIEPVGSAGPVEREFLCTQAVQVTHDVKTFVLEPPSDFPAHLPGQYLTFTVDIDGERLTRCYSIDSPPSRPGRLSITVKRVEGGPVSTHLHDRFGAGDRLYAVGPYGDFTFGLEPPTKCLFLTAGSGITPAMSMVRTLVGRDAAPDVVFVHNARTPDDIVFRDELREIDALPGYSVTVICEDDSPAEAWAGQKGRLTLRSLLRAAPDVHERQVFTCGPPPYMQAVRELLSMAAVDPSSCHEEVFDLAARGAGASLGRARTPGARRFSVSLERSGRVVECDEDEPILAACRRDGIPMPSMCTQGMCGTCMTLLLGGQVDMRHAGGIGPRDVADGKILTCCSRPTTDVVLDA